MTTLEQAFSLPIFSWPLRPRRPHIQNIHILSLQDLQHALAHKTCVACPLMLVDRLAHWWTGQKADESEDEDADEGTEGGGKSSWMSRIGSTVLEVLEHLEQVTEDWREPAKV